MAGDGTMSWAAAVAASHYRLDVASDTGTVFTALVAAPLATYRMPPFVMRGLGATETGLRWRVTALGPGGAMVGRSGWRGIKVPAPDSSSR
jgi:hypothetical protein